jgi:hypothetical protein
VALDTAKLTQICAAAKPADGPASLIEAINQAAGKLEFSRTYIDRDWYRVGVIVTDDGARVADDIEEWVTEEAGDDMIELLARYADSGYLATSVSGKVHFLSAPTGPDPLDFVQIEIEELREIADRELFDPERVPDTIEDVVDPMEFRPVEARPVGQPSYQFKQLTDFSQIAEELQSEFSGDLDFAKFVRDWKESSASGQIAFHKAWAVEVMPVLADVGEHKSKVRLRSPHGEAGRVYDMSGHGIGGSIAKMLAGVDREAGYTMAWYFLMLTTKFMSAAMVNSVHEELGWSQAGREFLSARDAAVLERWIEAPYTV